MIKYQMKRRICNIYSIMLIILNFFSYCLIFEILELKFICYL